MALRIKHVADLIGLKFRIPSYQRGYRWERKQIENLLDDLLEFHTQLRKAKSLDDENGRWNYEHESSEKSVNNSISLGFYCLQPLAVTKNGEAYDLIDGQQRLTTLYLILCYLSKDHAKLPYDDAREISDDLYTLSYESREQDFFDNKDFMNESDDESCKKNIDFYFMAKGYRIIDEWFQNHRQSSKFIKSLLLPDDYEYKDDVRNESLHDVRFIWYEIPQESSIDTFNNLNYGKIGLTASELVKALLFQCDNYGSDSKEVIKSNALRRSTKWSLMEETLQNEYFWGMLFPNSHDTDLHLKFILSCVAEEIDANNNYTNKDRLDKKSEDWVFCIFNKALVDNDFHWEGNDRSLESQLSRVEFLWDRIQKVFTVFHNWFEDRQLYHMVGLLVCLESLYSKRKQSDIIKDLFCNYNKLVKPEFNNYLTRKIGDAVRINTFAGPEVQPTEKRKKTLEELSYEDDAIAIKKILLLFNVELAIQNDKEEPRFPFHMASNLNSLEHIHPQNLRDDEVSYIDLKEWYQRRKKILEENGTIKKEPGLKPSITFLDERINDEELCNNNKSEILLHISIIDKYFDDLAGMKKSIMHSLYNMALIDIGSNASLQNLLLNEKRNKLIELSKERYIPIGTWHAFNKYYSKNVHDMKFWSENDRIAYFKEIEKVYNKYTE